MKTFSKDKPEHRLYLAELRREDTLRDYIRRHPDFRHLEMAVMAAFQPNWHIALPWRAYAVKDGGRYEYPDIFGIDLVTPIEANAAMQEADPVKFLNEDFKLAKARGEV